MDDELELEVSDLRTGRPMETALTREPAAEAHQRGSGAGDLPRDGEGEASVGEAPVVERMGPAAVRAARLPSLPRRARGYLVAAVVLLACTAILVTLPGAQQSIRRALAGPTPTPTATLGPDENVIGFVDGVPWGTLTVDGKPTDQQPGSPTVLGRGQHTVVYLAQPFVPVSCRLSVPTRPDDTCTISHGTQYSGLGMNARVIDLGCTPDRLPPDQRDTLMRAVAAAVQASSPAATVEPGDHYLGADGAPAVAQAQMKAKLALALNTDPGRQSRVTFDNCVTLCAFAGGGPPDQGPDAPWSLQAHVIADWQFTTADGSIIHPAGIGAETDALLTFGVRWAGSWSLTAPNPQYTGDVCGSFLTSLPTITALPGDSGNGGTSGELSFAPNGAEGCVETITPYQAGGIGGPPQMYATPTPTLSPSVTAVFLCRFGVIMAASEAAHVALPQLPVANAHEQALAQQWRASQ